VVLKFKYSNLNCEYGIRDADHDKVEQGSQMRESKIRKKNVFRHRKNRILPLRGGSLRVSSEEKTQT